MNTIQRCFLVIIFLFLYFTCAIPQNVSADPQYVIKEDVTGVVPKPSEGKAMVVFIRPSSFGFTISFRVYDGENLIGVLRSTTYFAYEITPGKHLFGGMSENYAFLEADLLEGKTYYILGRTYSGAWKVRVELRPIKPDSKDWKSLEGWLSRCSLIEITEAAYRWDKEKYEEVKARRDKYYDEWLKETKKHVINPEDGI